MISILPPRLGFSVWAKEMLRHREGAIGILSVVLLIPLILAVGLAVDFGRGYMSTRALQGIVDSAALAGATVFNDPSRQQLAIDTAQAYFTKGIATLPSNVAVGTPTITPSVSQDCAGTNPAYRITATVSATIGNTFMRLVTAKFPMTVTATAANPLVHFSIELVNFDFDAQSGDGNAVYWYQVPDDGVAPSPSILNLIVNNTTTSTKGSIIDTCINGSQKIGFAFGATPGQRIQYYTYNTYGGGVGNTYYYYSTLFPPQIQAYPTLATDNSLQIVAVNSDGSYPLPQTSSYPPTASDFQFPASFAQPASNFTSTPDNNACNGIATAPTIPLSSYAPENCMMSESVIDSGTGTHGYGCFPASAEPLATVASSGSVTCEALGSGGIHIYWNDMGPKFDPWNTVHACSYPSWLSYDNLNYTDAELTITCLSTVKSVHLEK